MRNHFMSFGAILAAGIFGAQGAWAGGTLNLSILADPDTLNPITSTDGYSSEVQGWVLESLMERDEDTWEWKPRLAESFLASKDGMTFTFKLRSGVKWSDGKPLTIEDVKFSFDVFFQGKFQNPTVKMMLQSFESPQVIDGSTIKFVAKEAYFKNFDSIASLAIIPKHFYEGGNEKDSKFNKTLIGTGPYVLDSYERGQKLVLKKNAGYWSKVGLRGKPRFLFDRVVYRIVREQNVELEMLKKGDLDFVELGTDKFLELQKQVTPDAKWEVVKTQNDSPRQYSYMFIAWNQKNPLFQDREVRQALSHLLNRELMVEKFFSGMTELARGPFGNRSPSSSDKIKPIEYNPKKAMELLTKKGWKLGPNGLEKEGKKFEFTLIHPTAEVEKYLTVFQSDLKKVGITLNLKLVEWNSFLKLIDERKYDALQMAWGVNSLESDPKQMFHSEMIPTPGQNFISYSNPELDKTIQALRKEMNEKKRRALFHRAHELIADDQPYTFFFNKKHLFYAVTKRIKRPQPWLKYGFGMEEWSAD